MNSIISAVFNWITTSIAQLGYYGIMLMMGIESACVPLPSEIIMPFGGYLVYQYPDRFNIWIMGIIGALGCVLGSVAAYWAGAYGGRPFVIKYGKFILVRERDLDKADRFFAKYGNAAIFISRILPVVRTFISFPAGISKMPFWRFCIYTFLGSFPWCIGLAYAGMMLGKEWDTRLKGYFHGADAIIVAVLAVLVGIYIWHHLQGEKEYQKAKEEIKL